MVAAQLDAVNVDNQIVPVVQAPLGQFLEPLARRQRLRKHPQRRAAGGSSKSGAKRDSKWCIGRARGDRHRSAKPKPCRQPVRQMSPIRQRTRCEGRAAEWNTGDGRERERFHPMMDIVNTDCSVFVLPYKAILDCPIDSDSEPCYVGSPGEKGSLRKPPFSERTMSRTASLFLVPAVLLLALAASASAELPASPTEGDATVTTSTTTVAPASECVEPASAEAGETVPAGVVPACSEAMLEIIQGMVEEQCGEEGGAAIAVCTVGGADISILCGDVDVVRSGGGGVN